MLVILLVLAAVVLLGMKFTSNRDGGLGGGGNPVVYTVKVKNVEGDVYRSIQEQLPSQLMASGELLDGYVTAVEGTPVEEDIYTTREDGNASTLTLEHIDEDIYDLVFTVEANLKNEVTNALGTQEVRVGKYHIVKTATFELDGGVILSCEPAA